ncbi:transmembrane protein 223 [Brienomyrus brachyistius]|uniref:transmembrane protein 223 n=1 Tax=Brienomyrus brachyistius TaxID=42636 RepID=UPI0020B1FCED|nr:transmembrane protein 223 [Brienomyrus brachyistius]
MGARYLFFAFLGCRPCSVTPCCGKFFGYQVIHAPQIRTFDTNAMRNLTLSKVSNITRGVNLITNGLSQKLSLVLNSASLWRDSLKRLFIRDDASTLKIARKHICVRGLKPASTISQMQKRCFYVSVNANAVFPRSYSTSTAIARDVVLFEHDRTGFIRLLTAFCACQVIFWTYLAHFAFTSLRKAKTDNKKPTKDVEPGGDEGLPVFGVSLGTNTWRFGFTLGCLALGGTIVGLGVLFSRRSVSRVVLHKGGGTVTVKTQSPFGVDMARHITVPLSHVTCHAHRMESPSFIPLRVKGHRFYFLLDKDGKLNNNKLFDITVGAYRPL